MAATATTVGGLTTTRRVAAEHTSGEWAAKPEHVTLEFDKAFLRKHRPVFVSTRETRQQYKGLYGYKATSDEYDYDYAYYWSQLTHQEGLLFVSKDTHLGDHEPLICCVSKDSGELESVIWTEYHHFAAEQPADALQVVSSATNEKTHPVFEIDTNWHNYYDVESDDWSLGDFELKNWIDVRDSWRDNGFYEETSAKAIEDPETMQTRDTWWADGTSDKRFALLWRRLGRGGADRADNLRVD